MKKLKELAFIGNSGKHYSASFIYDEHDPVWERKMKKLNKGLLAFVDQLPYMQSSIFEVDKEFLDNLQSIEKVDITEFNGLKLHRNLTFKEFLDEIGITDEDYFVTRTSELHRLLEG